MKNVSIIDDENFSLLRSFPLKFVSKISDEEKDFYTEMENSQKKGSVCPACVFEGAACFLCLQYISLSIKYTILSLITNERELRKSEMADACFLLIFIIITERNNRWPRSLTNRIMNDNEQTVPPSFSRSLRWRATEIKAIVRRVIPHFELSHVVETNVVIFLVSNARFVLRVLLFSDQFYITKRDPRYWKRLMKDN